jgi:hypothetical protein
MASVDAIAFLGDTIVAILQKELDELVKPNVVSVLQYTPTEFKNFAPVTPTVTLFLYHVAICGEMRNARSRSIGGIQVPSLPLELRYLVTPWTRAPGGSYLIIGAIAQVFYRHSVLNFGELLGSGWAPDDTVEIILESVPVEEHYDIWKLTDIPYRLSLTYLVRLVGIDADQPEAPPPVAAATFPELLP